MEGLGQQGPSSPSDSGPLSASLEKRRMRERFPCRGNKAIAVSDRNSVYYCSTVVEYLHKHNTVVSESIVGNDVVNDTNARATERGICFSFLEGNPATETWTLAEPSKHTNAFILESRTLYQPKSIEKICTYWYHRESFLE